jgi:Ca-activated chloride channel family protein
MAGKSMADLHFIRPYWLISLLPALLIWYGLWRQGHSQAALRSVIDPLLLENLIVPAQKSTRIRPIYVLLLLWVLTALALSGPAWKKEPSPFTDDTAGLMVVLKVSGTMNATDVQPSRLERAKYKLKDILEQRTGAATGLVVYSGSAHIVMPLTRDSRIINTMIEDLGPDLMPVEGDALADALDISHYLFERSGAGGSILVLADSVAPSQLDELSESPYKLPLQFLSVQSESSSVDKGLERAASALDADIEKLTLDQEDVKSITNRARTEFASMKGEDSESQWLDAGYYLLPFIALLVLLWSRQGWVVR